MTTRERLAGMGPSDTLLQFARALTEACALPSGNTADALYFFEKPWKWAAEFDAWEAAGSPSSDEDGWAAFEDALAVIA